jgi:hypothetical protein
MTPETTRDVRRLLYERNFDIRNLELAQGPDLQDAIKLLQKKLGQAETGMLTVPQLEALRRSSPPSPWGAIGYTGTGGHVGVTQRPSRARAEEEAKAECQSKAHLRCQTLTVAGNRCVALVHSRGSYLVESYVAFGDDPPSARQSALTDCKAKARLPENCEARETLCADGRT